MKYVYRICLFFIFSTGLSALEMTCPFECNNDPKPLYNKIGAIRTFLQEGYPSERRRLHKLYTGSYCNGGFRVVWYEIGWNCIFTCDRFVAAHGHDPDEIPDYEDKIFDFKNLAVDLSLLSQFQNDVDHYIQNEKHVLNQALRWHEDALKYFQGLREKGRTTCCVEPWVSAESVDEKIMSMQRVIEEYQKKHDDFQIQAGHLQSKLDEARETILRLHEEQYQNCIQNHQWTGAYYNRGLLNFSRGQIDEALEDIRRFMDGLKDSEKALLSSEEYLNEGIIQSEVNLYNDAIVSLSKAILKDPNNKIAYFERAAAYFETGEFDLALSDYLASGMRATIDEPGISFSKDYAQGLVDGIKKGFTEEFGEGLPVWSPILGVGLWALTSSPSPHAKLVSGVLACVAASAAYIAADQISSELKELVTNWDHLTQKERGEISSYLIGKYGVDIFFMAGSAKMMKAYQDLKRANNVLTFEMMLLEESRVASLKNRYKAIEKYKKDKEYIKKYFGKNSYSEQEIRNNLKTMGYQIPKKPDGIPDNFITKYADGVGICYHNPANPKHEYIRLMPGNPNSPNPAQQQPYIVHYRNGKALNSQGNLVDRGATKNCTCFNQD